MIHRTALIVLVLAAFFTVAPAGGVPIPVIANGVTIGDVEVGGLIAVAAQDRVERTYGQPIHLFHKDSSVAVSPARFGAEAAIEKSVEQAMDASPGAHLQLDVVIRKKQVDKFVRELDRRFARKPVNAKTRRPHRQAEARHRALASGPRRRPRRHAGPHPRGAPLLLPPGDHPGEDRAGSGPR